MINKEAPFPQADDFEKVLSIINVDDPVYLKNTSYVSMIIGELTDRQVGYYLAACRYLGLLDNKREFTIEGNRIRALTGALQLAEIAKIIVSDETFGSVYFQQKVFGFKFDKEDVVEIMKTQINFSSNEMYNRRATTVISWINWIYEQEQEF